MAMQTLYHGIKCTLVMTAILFMMSCSRSAAELYVQNLSVYENVKGKPIYIEEASQNGIDTIRLFYSDGRCAGWEKGDRWLRAKRTIEYDGNTICKYSEVQSSKYGDDCFSYFIKSFANDSIVVLDSDGSLAFRIFRDRLVDINENGETYESLLNSKGRIVSSDFESFRRELDYNKNGDVIYVKYTDKEKGSVQEYRHEYLSWDNKGNWTTKVINETDTITRILCYNKKEYLAHCSSKENARMIMAKEYLDKNFPEFYPWKIV